MQNSFYDKKIEEIEKLVSSNNLKLVLEILSQELSMPYIPFEYEKKFNDLLTKINQMDAESIDANFKVLSLESFMDYLNSKDDFKISIALNSMENLNLNAIKEELKTWIEDQLNLFNLAKVFILEQMALQKVDIDIVYNNVTFNPLKRGSVFQDPKIINYFIDLEKMAFQNPSLEKIAFDNLKSLIFITYPNFDFSNDISKIILKISQKMLGENLDLTEQEEHIFKLISKQ